LMLAPMWTLVLANIYFGIDTSLTTEAARSASEWLFQTTTLSTSQLSIDPFNTGQLSSKALGVAP
jgi:multicomponent Na+:H+ antiporter subunit D